MTEHRHVAGEVSSSTCPECVELMADRQLAEDQAAWAHRGAHEWRLRAQAAEAKLAAVRALCEKAEAPPRIVIDGEPRRAPSVPVGKIREALGD